MARKKFTPFKPYETARFSNNGKTLNEQHIRLTRSMLLSPAYKDLGKNATKILNAMKLIAKGEQEFEFSCSLGTEFLGISTESQKNVRLAIKKLIEHGFIKRIHFSNGVGHIPNKYSFDNAWINWKKDT